MQCAVLQFEAFESLQLMGACSDIEQIRRYAREFLNRQRDDFKASRYKRHRGQRGDHAVFAHSNRNVPAFMLQQYS